MIKILCIGKIKEEYLSKMINDYKTRISKYHKIEIIELKDSTKQKEAEGLTKHINENDFNICMDIKGKKVSSIELSNIIESTFIQSNGTITFIIGGSEGLEEYIKDKCNLKLSFSELTFPHGLFRGILLEQIYRSFKIINKETYALVK